MTGQTGKRAATHVSGQEPLQRRGSVYALMQQQMIAAAVSPAAQVGKRASMQVTGSEAEASRGKDVDPFLSKTICNNSSDSSDDDDYTESSLVT